MPRQNTRIPATNAESTLRRRLVGMFLFPIAMFPLLALLSYDWRDISELCIPPMRPSANLIGIAGDYFAWYGYTLVGFAVWFVPALIALAGFVLSLGRSIRPGKRTVGLCLFIFSAICLFQLAGYSPSVGRVMRELNIEPNGGGAVGYLVMTRGLARFLSPFGSGVLVIALSLASIPLMIGLRTIVGGLARLTAWASDNGEEDDGDVDRDGALSALDDVRRRVAEERQAEKDGIAVEKAAARARREMEREQARQEREAKKAAREEAKARRAAEKLAMEAERQAEAEERRQMHEEQVAHVRAQHDAELGGGDDWVRPRTAAAPAPAVLPAAPAGAAKKPASRKSAPVAAPSAPSPSDAGIPADEAEAAPYVLPPPEKVLDPVPESKAEHGDVEAMEQRLVETLRVFHVDATPAFRVEGPVVTQYALTPAPGVKAERISSLSANLQMALEAKSVRILAPIPGKNAVGIEVPNLKPASVSFREIVDGELWKSKTEWTNGKQPKFHVPLLLGKDAAGNDLVADLAKIPHLLVAGATGQGKSVCLNSIINGLLMCRTPEQLRLIMVDPKRVEFTSYNRLPHLLVPVINDTKKVVFGLRWAVVEMDRRLKMFSRAGARNIVDFNTRKTVSQPDFFGGEETVSDPDMPKTLPYIVIVIDEVADIMLAAQKEVEPVIARLTALARATGIHLILATQRPDTKVITGTIKSNIPGRIAFKTSASVDSRTILDSPGAEDLIGRGDMLFRTSEGLLLRAQGSYISDGEISRVVEFICDQRPPNFNETLVKRLDRIKEEDPEAGLDGDEGEDADEEEASSPFAPSAASVQDKKGGGGGEALFRAALIVLRDTKRASISHLQRRMKIGYNHAARLMDELEDHGVIGPARGAGPREILIDPETLLNEQSAPSPDGGDAPDADGGEAELSVAAPATSAQSEPPPLDDDFGETL